MNNKTGRKEKGENMSITVNDFSIGTIYVFENEKNTGDPPFLI